MTEHHLSTDELAELDEGLLSPEQADAAREHLHGCEECRSRADAVAAARNTLAALPPVTMPDAVLARLEGALANEAATTTAPLPSETVMPNVVELSTRRRWLGQPTLAASAVAAVAVLLVGGIIIGHHNSPKHSDAATAAGGNGAATSNGVVSSNPADTFTTTSSGANYTLANLNTLVTHIVAPSATTPSGPDSPASSTAVPGVGAASIVPSPDDEFTSKTAPNTSGGQSSTAQGTAERSIPKVLRPIARSRAKLLDCASTVAGLPGAVPVAVDFARWSGGAYRKAPSIIMVFASTVAAKDVVYVVAPNCAGNALIRSFAVVTLPS